MTTPTNSPIVNAGIMYVNNGIVAVASNTTLTVTACQARDSTNVIDMVTTSTKTINAAVRGINGIDTGTFALSSWYAVHMVADSTGKKETGFVISLSATAPYLPSGYDSFRRIGWALTDASIHFISYLVNGTGTTKYYQATAGVAAVTGGSATSYTAISLIGSVPPQACMVYIQTAYTPAVATNLFGVRPSGFGSGTSGKGSVASVQEISQYEIACTLISSLPKIDYTVTASDAITIYGLGFIDSL